VQGIWGAVVGDTIAAHATVVAEHDGVLEIVCDESVWAAELELMGPDLIDRLTASLGRPAVVSLRCRTGP
jgi:predicted nucleic acid-binding Zn ribbon protein